MKTVFKVGMKVYDQVNFPDKEGKVEEIYIGEEEEYPIVSFGKRERICYSSDGRLSGRITKMLSTKPYKVVFDGFEQKAPAPTYEDAEEWIIKESEKGNIFLMSKDVLEALRRLVIIRDYYNEGWKPRNNSYVHIITTRNGELVRDCLMGDFRVLYFKSQEIRNTFFEEQKELLEIAKPLL
jgi:hypothetical protein